MRELVGVTKALADGNRLRILAALEGRELCLCQVVELLGLATSSVSRHVAILCRAGLAVGRKEGRWVYFRLAEDGDDPAPAARAALRLVLDALKCDKQAKADRARLKQILRLDPEALCRQHGKATC